MARRADLGPELQRIGAADGAERDERAAHGWRRACPPTDVQITARDDEARRRASSVGTVGSAALLKTESAGSTAPGRRARSAKSHEKEPTHEPRGEGFAEAHGERESRVLQNSLKDARALPKRSPTFTDVSSAARAARARLDAPARAGPSTPSKKRGKDAVAVARVTDSSRKAANKQKATPRDVGGRRLNFVRDEEDDEFVPVATHRLVGYAEKGQRVLDADVAAVFAFVDRACDAPDDLESNHKYGPKSGASYEERLISAYVHGLVPAPDDAQRRKLKKLVTQRRWAEAAAFAAAAN